MNLPGNLRVLARRIDVEDANGVVIVRKRRLASPVRDAQKLPPETVKLPRVHRLTTVDEAGAVETAKSVVAAVVPPQGTRADAVRRRKRRLEQRPGPAVIIVPERPPQVAMVDEFEPSVSVLEARLAQVDQTLRLIAQMQELQRVLSGYGCGTVNRTPESKTRLNRL